MIDYKFIIRGHGEGKTKQLVDCLMNSIMEDKLCVYVGSYYGYVNVKNIYEAITHEVCPLVFIDSDDKIKDRVNASGVDLFTDELTSEIGHILISSLGNMVTSKWASKFENTRWFITLDSSFVI